MHILLSQYKGQTSSKNGGLWLGKDGKQTKIPELNNPVSLSLDQLEPLDPIYNSGQLWSRGYGVNMYSRIETRIQILIQFKFCLRKEIISEENHIFSFIM